MRFIKLFYGALIWMLIALSASGAPRQLPFAIEGLTVQPVLPAAVSTWSLQQEAVRFTVENKGEGRFSRMSVRIMQSAGMVCGTGAPAQGTPVNNFQIKSFGTSDLLPALGACDRLAPGDYMLCIRFYGDEDVPLSEEVCASFRVEEAPPVVQQYAPPKNIAPADSKVFLEEEMQQAIRFQWTPVTPPATGAITYRLRLWPMREGQTAKDATQNGAPLITRDVEGTTLALTDELPVPCKSPYSCRFAWNVQALDAAGRPIGTNGGYSEATAIVVTTYIIKIDNIKVLCTEQPGVYTFSMTVTNLNPGTAKLTQLLSTSSVPAGAVVSSFTPPLNTNIASGATITVTGSITASPTLAYICIGAEITDLVNSFWKASKDTCIKVSPCKCTACDGVKLTINPTNNITLNANNTLTMVQPIIVGTTPLKLVKSVKAELQYFEFLPESEECHPCNKDPKTFGNLESGTLMATTGVGGGSHALQWNFSPPKNMSSVNNASMVITMPPTVRCCSATIRWCIRYVFTFQDCTVCSKVVCYEKKKQGCSGSTGTGDVNPNPNN